MDLNVKLIKSVLNIFEEMVSNGASLVYLGEFSHDITKMFTRMAESDMDKNEEERRVKKKVYHVMVETLQNMNKHSDEISNSGQVGNGLFVIGKIHDEYYVITANKVEKDKTAVLEQTLEEVNAASKDELKKMYLKQIKEGKLSNKGGAGLGLIDIARKTDTPLTYRFIPIDDDYNLFILKVDIIGAKVDRAND
ncbi:MAG: SiaB family protein kinase [Cyclobacteriaceae bacterium]|nr:SiaB family protein kinase [Cyclobacteriaceae bacterium]MCH8516053.1 SiaB family protein kinase [Cyclobacteriaceae bacterium]